MPQQVPFGMSHIQHIPQLLGRKRKKRLECNRQISRNLQCQIQNRRDTRHIGLRQFPRFCICQIFITDTGKIHRLFQGITETVILQIIFKLDLYSGKFVKRLFIILGQLSASRNFPTEILMSKNHCTVHKIP